MRRYDDGEFIENEPNRKPIRDTYRDKFFAELGVERLKDPFAFDPNPESQLSLVTDLIARAISIHGGDQSGLTMSKALVSSSALGVPLAGLGATKLGRPGFQEMTVRNMAQSMFDRWVGLDGRAEDEGA